MNDNVINIDIDFVRSSIEEIQNDFFNNEMFAYMALNGEIGRAHV